MFDLSPSKLLILAVLALLVFGPRELPKMAAQVGRALRELRRIAEGAKTDLREGLGPEFSDLEIEDLNPRRFVQKHLLGDFDISGAGRADTGAEATEKVPAAGSSPVFDADAT